MSEFLQSIKSDLLSRRLLPFVALAVVVLIVAVAYAVAGGSGGSAPAPSGGRGVARATTGTVVVAVAPANPTEAVSETPAGARYQSQGPTRDPFTPLPTPPAPKASASSSSSSASASSKSGAGSSGSSSGGSGGGSPSPPPTPAKPSKPSKPSSPYVVSVLFGLLPASNAQSVTLTPYENLTAQQPLPSKQSARIVYQRVTSDGKGAVFGFVAPPILRGSGVCLPSASECQSLDLETGHSEELEYVEADGNAAIYELKIVSIAKTSAAAARAKASAKAAVAKTRKP